MLSPVNSGSFLSDGRRVVYMASESGRPLRTWLQDINGAHGAPSFWASLAGRQKEQRNANADQ